MGGEKLLIPPDIPEFYVERIGKVVAAHGNVRYYLCADRPQQDGTIVREAVLCVIAPISAVREAMQQLRGVTDMPLTDTLN